MTAPPAVFDSAEAALREAIGREPGNGAAQYRLGILLAQRGRFAEARVALEHGLVLEPRRAAAYFWLVNTKRLDDGDRLLLAPMRALAEDPDLSAGDRAILHFALGKAHDDLAEYEAAIGHFDAANRIEAERLRCEGPLADPEEWAAKAAAVMATATVPFFARHAGIGSDSEVPVLIVGMPRSGTTLIEQMLSRHPEVAGAGELDFWQEEAIALGPAPSLDAEAAGRLAENYLARLRAHGPAARRVTDKMPNNFQYLGLVHLAFPRARVIHCRRHPVDTSLSIYFTAFERITHLRERGGIVAFYEGYRRLMEHWRRVLPPDHLIEVDYEAVVADPEGEARRLIAFLGLDWDDACLSPEANPRLVHTASLWQARQPVYRNAVGRWRHYQPWLGEFARLLPDAPKGAAPPQTPAALLGAAIAAFRAERREEAAGLCRAILARDPQSLPALHMLAVLAAQEGRRELAIPLMRAVVAREPNSVEALNQLAALLHGNGRGEEAKALCEQALALAPDDPQTLHNLGLALLAEHRFAEAGAVLRRAVAGAPGAVPPRIDLARTLAQGGDAEAAEGCLREALTLAPGDLDLHRRLGILFQEYGRFDEAIAAFDEAIALDPRRTALYLDRIYCRKTEPEDAPLIARMRVLLDDERLGDQDRANLHFALGKAADDLGNYAEAMRHFDEANRLKPRGRPFDRAAFAGLVGRLIRAFDRDLFARGAALGSASDVPVLIVGMPRSGTTLVDRILSSHPQISSGGELVFWGQQMGAVLAAAAGRLEPGPAQRLAADYLALLRRNAPAARRVTDKMPQNFLQLGLVHLLLPQARIIHCRRNAIDTCLSIYSIQFTDPLDFAYHRGDLVFYYEQYARLMAHWRSVLPEDRLLEIDYEALVADCERASRQMIAFCGLAWDEACLHFERNAGAIRTASLWQARQPLFASSLERWRRYEPWLGEFLRLLPQMVRTR